MRHHPYILPIKMGQQRDFLKWEDVYYYTKGNQRFCGLMLSSLLHGVEINVTTTDSRTCHTLGRKPDLSKMWVFRTESYVYKHDSKK